LLYWNALIDPPAFFTLYVGIGFLAALSFFCEYKDLIVKKQLKSTTANGNGSEARGRKSFKLLLEFLGPKSIIGLLFPIICAAGPHAGAPASVKKEKNGNAVPPKSRMD
jgi:hypothetical protein